MMLQSLKRFVLAPKSLVCPTCETEFASISIANMPNITVETKIEADLHRVLPDAAFRSALLAMCPSCSYTWWTSSFKATHLLPQMLPDAPVVEHAKKFAYAVLTGRKTGAHALDTALLALNGAWCAAEEFESREKWLTLSRQDLELALADEEWTGNRGRYQYILGEVLRQLGDFHGAVRLFNQVDRRSLLPKDLVDRQRALAINGNSEPQELEPHHIEIIFLPRPAVVPQAASSEVPVQPAQLA